MDFSRFRKYKPMIEKLSKERGCPKIFFYLDAVRCKIIHGAGLSYYLSLGFYKMNHSERKTYMTGRRTLKIEKAINTSEEWKRIIDNKAEFNKKMAKYIKREWLSVDESTNDAIISFMNRYSKVIIKPAHANMGQGIRIIDCRNINFQLKSFWKNIRDEHAVVEQIIEQHASMRDLNPTSVNTIRIATVRDKKNNVQIVGASLRVGGKGMVVDNLHEEGVQYPVDPESGIVIGTGVNHAGISGIYKHPSSGYKVIGMQIPNWDMVKSMIFDVAVIPDNLRYVGWDIAITPGGCELVEGNIKQGCNGMQLDGVGKYKLIKAYI